MILTTYDKRNDVLLVFRDGHMVTHSREGEDPYLILDHENSATVGARLICAAMMPWSYWSRHPDRASIPGDVLAAADEWVRENGKPGP